MVEETLRDLGVIARANTVMAVTQAIMAMLILLFYFVYLFKNKGD